MDRGIRINNPGNIDRGADKWQGMAADQSADDRFVVFVSPQYGIRALAKVLLSYQLRDGCDTIAKLITRWAPPAENNTAAYIAHVASLCGKDKDATIDVDSYAVMFPLVSAIIAHENDGYAYPRATVDAGLRLAGVVDAPKPALIQQGHFQAKVGAVTAGVAGVATKAGDYAPTVKHWYDQLAAYAGSPIIGHVANVLLTVAGGLMIMGIAGEVLKQRSST